MKSQSIVGIDEVGRGPIAGPVAVGAFLLKITNYELRIKVKNSRLPIRDSKKLTEKQREEWFKIIKKWKKEGKVDYAVSFVSAKVVDKIGIVPAIKKALAQSIKKLAVDPKNTLVLLDGGLKASEEYKNQKTIIKGDEKEPVISLASIVAKVSRDRLMCRLGKKFPCYGLEKHKGYGTNSHYKAINSNGHLPLHRQSFLKKLKK
ncbi:MAG: ribonuclease HII [Candidatus Paceibacterota bacterium]|jgi:ribonuclease HII